MNAQQKLAWIELIVSLTATLLAVALFPWIGTAALGCFGLLGFLGITPLILRPRGNHVVRDERDLQIEMRSSWMGFGTAWTLMLITLAAITLWYDHHERDVPTVLLGGLIWIQFALCFAIKGAATLFQYRGTNRAA